MPEAWRIVRARHADGAFSGEGAAKYGGRWNSRGVAAVYLSSTRALAVLETLVHLNPPMVFAYKLFRIEFEKDLVEQVRESQLPADWRNEPPSPGSQLLGDAWFRQGRSALLAVPSTIIPDEQNYLLNPAHPQFKQVIIHDPVDFVFDPRLVR